MARMQVWQDINFQGNSIVVEASIENLAQFGDGRMNDAISSFTVDNGQWILWSDANFSGVGLEVGPGQYPVIANVDNRFNDIVSSIQVKVE